MTEEIIKEELSNNFISALACCNGYMLSPKKHDYGVDFELGATSIRTEPSGGTRRFMNTERIDIQMKSTTFKNVVVHPDYINYPFEAKNYNDLIYVNNIDKGRIPRILVLFILPMEREKWVEVDAESLILRHSAYWYKPGADERETSNSSTIQVKIPKAQRFAVDTWPALIEKFYPKNDL